MQTTMRLSDFVDHDLLQDLQNAAAAFFRMPMAIVDPQGYPVTVPSKPDAPAEHRDAPRPVHVLAHADVPAAAVMIFVKGVWLGQWLIGGASPLAVQPDAQTLVFMPMGTRRRTSGTLGFGLHAIRDWPPEALTRFWDIARTVGENINRNYAVRKRCVTLRGGAFYERPRQRHGIAL